MFKDYKKYLSTSLKVYLFVLIFIFIMKLVGLNYFGIDLNNPIIAKVDGFFKNWYLKDLWYVFTLWLYGYFIISITCSCNNKEMKIYSIMCIPIFYLATYLETKYSIMILNCFIDFGYLLLLSYLFNLRYKCVSNKKLILNYAKIIILNLFFQIISVITRVGYFEKSNYNFIVNFILDLDYLLLFIIYHKLYFKGGEKICLEMVVSSFSQRKINLKKSLKKLHQSWLNFRKQPKQIKLEISIYFVLSLIWNVLSVVLILFVAKLNHTFIECIFILTSFWLSKKAFGKAFHLSSMMQCFVVSNLTYYVLNRITTPLGISIIIPILLGVGLSYVTSKLVKKIYKPLYRGMSEKLFNETILKIVDKDSEKYKICYDYYIKKERALALSFKYKYSEAGIRKIKDRVNEKIKELE